MYNIFIGETYVQHFYTNDQLDCLFLAIFQSFYWFVSFIFDKLTPLECMFQKML